jgi:hypothetical protein
MSTSVIETQRCKNFIHFLSISEAFLAGTKRREFFRRASLDGDKVDKANNCTNISTA